MTKTWARGSKTHVQKTKIILSTLWNSLNVSLLIKFFINKEALWLLVSQAALLSWPSPPGSLHISPTPYILYWKLSTSEDGSQHVCSYCHSPSLQTRPSVIKKPNHIPNILLSWSFFSPNEFSITFNFNFCQVLRTEVKMKPDYSVTYHFNDPILMTGRVFHWF